MAFLYDEMNLIGGYPTRTALSVSGTGGASTLFHWYDTIAAKWYLAATRGFPVSAGGTTLLTQWYNKNTKYFYADTALSRFLWWSSTLSLWVVSGKLGGGVAETWVYTDPEDEAAGGAYQGDDWWSFSAMTGTFLPRGAKRGTTEGAYDSANNMTVALSDADRFELAGSYYQGVYTGYGVFDTKTLIVGVKKISLVEGDNTFIFIESWPSGYAFRSNPAVYPSYIQQTDGDLLLDKSYVAAFDSVATVADGVDLAFVDSDDVFCCNEIILS